MVTKGSYVRGELDSEQTATYWPTVLLSFSALLSRSVGLLNRGSWGPIALCWVLVLTAASYLRLDWLQLTEPICGSGSYNFLSSACFWWASHLHPIQVVHSQDYTPISSTGCTSSKIGGWIRGQYVTQWWYFVPLLKSPPLICTQVHKETNKDFFLGRTVAKFAT